MGQAKRAHFNHILPERLRIARKRLGLTQQALANVTGFSLSAIGNWESGQNFPSPQKLGSLAKVLCVTIDYLMGHDVAMNSGANNNQNPSDGAGGPNKPEVRQVPIVTWTQAADLESHSNLNASLHDYIATTCRDVRCFAVTLEGDSMEPKFGGGDLVVLMPGMEPRNGCLVVCRLKDEGLFFKLFHQSIDGKIYRLSSYNPVYPVMECGKKDMAWIYPVSQVIKNVWR